MSPPKGEGLLFRDSVDVQPPDLETEETKASDANPYHKVLPPKFLACPKADPWAPVAVVEEEVVATTTKKKKDSKIQRAINSALEHPASTVLLMVMTFWSLFSDDIRVAALTKEVDVPFAIVTLVFMAIFLLETILRSWVALGFFLSFNFWLDLIATASMVLDFEVLWGECASVDTPCCLFRDAEVASEDEALAVLGSIQTATRIGRVLRLFRVVRVFRLIALIGKKQKEEEELKPSAVGKRYNELIVMKVVITVVLTLLVNQQLEPGELDLSIEFGLRMLTLGYNTSSFTGMVSDYEVRTLNMTFQELMVLNVEAATEYPAQKVQGGCYFDTTQAGGIHPVQGLYCCPERRATEIKQYIYNQTSMAAFDVKLVTRSGGLHNIVNTIFLALLLTTMFFLFSRDVTKMVVRPIESMIDIVRKLAENPSLTLAGQSKSKYETESVRVALAKIVGLMQLGFGGAGHEIIAANLANAEGQDLDLMVRGKKLDCAYGFCDIRQFTDTVECLQDQVMLFTNSVGTIVHQACHDNRGEPNKNIGDAFLIVWRPKAGLQHTKIVDGALTAFRRCVREIASSNTLQLVTNVEAVHKKFGYGKYRTKLGFGLHFGWSVEGPVGTPMKIDCSYLSPEVKISDRLEAATKIYSSNILMSGQFYDLLSDHMKVGIRLVDHITLKGGHKPFRIYACDRSNLWLKINPRLVEIYGAATAYEQFSKTFHEGVDAFIKGDWPTAWQKLEGAAEFCPQDTPTKLLMKEMRARSIDPQTPTAPVDWKGYHDSEV